jgi:hypothetical protein
MPRPTKLTPAIQTSLVDVFSAGSVSIANACSLVGIAPSTYYQWMNTNPEFSEAIKRARAQAVMDYLKAIKTAANTGTWQAAAWWLERTHPDEYGRKIPVEVITEEQLMREIRRLEVELAQGGPD